MSHFSEGNEVGVIAPEAAPVAMAVDETEAAANVSGDAPAAEAVEPAVEAASAKRRRGQDAAANARVVRMLAVGQEVKGTVKRVSEFGAFVDIGVGRDGLVHISELSVRRVSKVSDVLHEGQEVTLWIKKLDRDKNRISLTMIPPETKTLRDLQKDDIVQGTVTRIVAYGAFVDLGVGRDALLHVREMSDRYVAKPEDVVKVGDQIEAKIIEIQRRRGRIDLSMKGLHPEPEPEPEPEPVATPEPEPQMVVQSTAPTPEPEDPYAESEPLSSMEAAFKKAMESSGGSFQMTGSDKKPKSKYREKTRAVQEDIFSRTLKQGKQ